MIGLSLTEFSSEFQIFAPEAKPSAAAPCTCDATEGQGILQQARFARVPQAAVGQEVAQAPRGAALAFALMGAVRRFRY